MPGYDPDRYARKKAAGICTRCPSPALPGETLCVKHAQQNRDVVRAFAEARVSLGLCRRCGKRRAAGRKHCADCLAKMSAEIKEKRHGKD